MLDLQALDRALYSIEAAAGTGWLEEHTHMIKDVEEKKGPRASFVDFTGLGVPPLAYIWYKAREILALGQVLGSIKPGYWGLTAAWLGQNIAKVVGVDGVAALIGRLKSSDEFRAANGELIVAAGYLALEARVSFAKEGGGFTVAPNLRVFCLASGAEAGSKSDRFKALLFKYESLASGFSDGGVTTLVYQEVMLDPGEDPEKVLADLAEKMPGHIKAGRSKLVLVSNIMEGAPGKERLRLWSEIVMAEHGHSSEIYLPRLTFPPGSLLMK